MLKQPIRMKEKEACYILQMVYKLVEQGIFIIYWWML